MNQISEALHSRHQKSTFSCGKEMLDNYIHKQAKQDVKRKLSACFVICDTNTGSIQGYYTLSNSSIPLETIPGNIREKLPMSYSSIPTTLLGRLAIDKTYQGRGFGKLILIDALKRCYTTSKVLGSFAVIVDPIDQDAINFYDKYGFVLLPDSGKMFLPMQTIHQLFK